MKRITRKIMLVLVMAALCFAVAVTANALEPTGQCGDNAYWNFDSQTGTLTISGEGDMWNYNDEVTDGMWDYDDFIISPFFDSGVKELVIEEGITSVGESVFRGCMTLEKVTLPTTIKTIGGYAFDCATELKEINFPEGLLSIGEFAFDLCVSLEEVNLPDSIETMYAAAFRWCTGLKEIRFPAEMKVEGSVISECHYTERVYIESMDDDEASFLSKANTDSRRFDLTREELIELTKGVVIEGIIGEYNGASEELEKHTIYMVEDEFLSTIYCHEGSNAEAFAKQYEEYGADYVLTHFFKGEWTYDYENMVRTRKCIYCDEIETEALEKEEIGDVEIINPSDPDTDFIVDEIVKGGDSYIIIENALDGNISGDWEVVKAFDITLKNHDGVHIQPDGTVKVKLPLDWSKDGIYKVYRVNDDGTLTDMNAYRQGSHMVFETDHFSIYVIVDESEKADIPEDAPTEAPAEKLDFIQKLLNFFTSLLEFFRSLFGI